MAFRTRRFAIAFVVAVFMAVFLPVSAFADESAEQLTFAEVQENTELIAEADGGVSAGTYVFDNYGLFSAEQRATLEERAAVLARRYNVGVYLLVVDKMNGLDNPSSSQRTGFAVDYYRTNELGLGSGKDGIMLTLAVDSRDYVTIGYGQSVNMLSNDGIEKMEEVVKGELRNNNWYAGANKYYGAIGNQLEYFKTYGKAWTDTQGGGTSADWKRLAGGTAYGTMVAAVNEGWTSADAVVVATFDGYWDALAASALAGSEGAPVLLTDTKSLSSETRSLIGKLGAKRAYVCGGPGAVSTKVEAQLKGMGLAVERLGGKMAFNTAELISARAKSNLGSSCDTCVVATIDGFYDSLSMAPGAYALGIPVYLTGFGKTLEASTVKAIKDAGYTKAVIVGGTSAVKPLVEGQLRSAGVKSVTRIGGANAWQTSEKIAKWGLVHGLSASTVGVADGNGYWDALTGAPMIGSKGGSLVLVPHSGPAFDNSWLMSYDPYCIDHFITDNAGSISQGYVFGGEAAVSRTAYDACVRATSSSNR